MFKLSLKVYLVCGYAILALLFLPVPVFANSNCAQNPKACTYFHLCVFATQLIYETRNTTKERKWADGKWSGHVKEAKRRGLLCSIKTTNPTKILKYCFSTRALLLLDLAQALLMLL